VVAFLYVFRILPLFTSKKAKQIACGSVGGSMIEYAQKGLIERGVTKLHMNVKLEHDFGSLLKRMGFTPIETIYEKLLAEV